MQSFIADVILICLAVLAPPAVAHIKTGRKDLKLSFILTLFGWLPGILHAWFLLVKYPESERRQQAREPLTEVVYIEGPRAEAQIPPPPQSQQQWAGDVKHPPTYAN